MNFLKFKPLTFLEKLKVKRNLIGIILFAIIIGITAFLDITLAVGIILIGFLSLITFLILSKTKIKSKALYAFLLIVLLIHFGAVLFIHYAHFQPFGRGSSGYGDYNADYIEYNVIAQQLATRIHQGNFSLQELKTVNDYPAIVGYIYALTLPEMLIGQLFAVWSAAISVLLVYLIVLEIGGTEKQALLIGLITAIYPSHLFYGSLLLKDTLVIPLVLAGLLLTIKLIKNFSLRNFLILYIVLAGATHFRFYVGYALIATFIISWFLLSKMDFKKRILYGIIFIVFLGFIPQFAAGQGYYGINSVKTYLNPNTVNFYRQVAYTPPTTPPSAAAPVATPPSAAAPVATPSPTTGIDSSFATENSPLGYIKSFVYVSLGPFPWQIKNLRQSFILLETIPWYFLLFFIIKGIIMALQRKRIALPLLIFSIILLGTLAIFITNFGIVTRIRIPAFISLLCIASLGFNKNNIICNYLEKIYGKVFNCAGCFCQANHKTKNQSKLYL